MCLGTCSRAKFAASLVDQVFHNGTALGHGNVAIRNHRRFPQGVNFQQFGWGQVGFGVARIAGYLVRQAKFFKQPDNALRARVFQVVYFDHGRKKGLVAKPLV